MNLYFTHNGQKQLMIENCTYEDAVERVQKYMAKHNPNYKMRVYDKYGAKHFDLGYYNKYFVWDE